MLKKAVLMVFAAMLLIAGAGIASANQVDGMVSGTGPALPAGLTVSVNPGGLGDGLIYGYYNTRNALTFFRIVNTSTTDAVKARVRFREAKTSAEILDFNVCLSNKDQWSAWILTNGNGVGAGIYPVDAGLERTVPGDTITAPNIPQLVLDASGNLTGGVPFKCGFGGGCSVTGVNTLANVTADDTMEGYFEIIGEVAIPGGTETTKVDFTATQCLNNLGAHDGVNLLDVPNVLGGDASVIVVRPEVSGMFSYNAIALADCRLTTDFVVANESPTWANCFNGLNGVDYALTKRDHIAMYNVENWDSAQTEVIMNFPTKSLHTIVPGTPGWNKPFDTVDSAKCEPIDLNIYNDLQDTTVSQTDFSPASGSSGATLCNEVNVIKIDNSDIMNSGVAKTLDVSGVTPFTGLGWIRIGLATGGPTCVTGNSTCFTSNVESFGLPSLGYVLTDLVGKFSAMNETKYTTHIFTSDTPIGDVTEAGEE